MNGQLTIAGGNIQLRSITRSDLEFLRILKNANREYFFYKNIISADAQAAWFKGYLDRPGDHMFVVQAEDKAAGCMGFRLEPQAVDCYNIIGAPACAGKGIMKRAMQLMCSYALKTCTMKIGLQVLKDNPAVGFYKKCGFEILGEGPDYYQMMLSRSNFKALPFQCSGETA
jgi:ribosomal protein S18 acetylase RimI-like enzyme